LKFNPPRIDDPGLGTGQRHDLRIVPDSGEFPGSDGDGAGGRVGPVERREQPTMQDEVGGLGFGHGNLSLAFATR
jgi:hypothetical protein